MAAQDISQHHAALTHRLEVLAHEAINATDPLFQHRIGCDIREYRVLKMVQENPGIEFNEIMRITGLDRSLVSRLLRSLMDKEWIYRVNNPKDARRFGLHTNALGHQKYTEAKALSEAAEAILLKTLNPSEQDELNQTLGKILSWVRTDEYRALVGELEKSS
ncbi:MAG: winged helix-turn-helix transcriptional regulator [Gammaproteobacteria bacterium]|nr:winged helix-turn-helix transcriptional regulator [Gammaproteobacteria bacterium]